MKNVRRWMRTNSSWQRLKLPSANKRRKMLLRPRDLESRLKLRLRSYVSRQKMRRKDLLKRKSKLRKLGKLS